MSTYQKYQEGLGTLLIDKYGIDNMDDYNLKKAYTRAIDRNAVYSSNEDYAIMYKDILDIINDNLANSIDNLNLNRTELKFYYALGVSYGMSN